MRFIGSRRLIKNSGLFDPLYYLIKNPDVRIADVDPLNHFLKYGWKEGRNPSVGFDIQYYLTMNPDVKNSGVNPLIHYLKKGKKEGRQPFPSAPRVSQDSPKNVSSLPITKLSVENLRKIFPYIKKYGLKNFFRKASTIAFPKAQYNKLESTDKVKVMGMVEKARQFVATVPVIDKINVKISIIIPTKDAGNDLPFLLKTLCSQKGFREIEVIVVDSGSKDDTIQVAESHNAIVIKIDPSEFSHSYARNLGAEHATGDYLLFTVQDALPPNSTWLYELFQVLKQENVVAVSCAETPREDADLFYRQLCWNHYNFLGINEGDRIFSLPEELDHVSLRKNAQLSDLANLISRNVFSKYRYRLNYAEDLDLGIRLIRDGYKIAFLGSVRIIHSHNRSPYYFLKRGYVDNQFLSNIFDDFVTPKICMQSFVPDIAVTYVFLNQLISYISNLPRPLTPDMFETKIREFFKQGYVGKFLGELPAANEQYLDQPTREFLENLINVSGFQYAGKNYNGFFITTFLDYIGITFNYLKNSYEYIDDLLLIEIKKCFYKAFSMLVGAHLAYCSKNRNGNELQDMDNMHNMLMEGV